MQDVEDRLIELEALEKAIQEGTGLLESQRFIYFFLKKKAV
jgi:hypothetical protein